jgi:hypothetical protein
MKLVGGIHIPNDLRERFSKKCEAEKARGSQIFEDPFSLPQSSLSGRLT